MYNLNSAYCSILSFPSSEPTIELMYFIPSHDLVTQVSHSFSPVQSEPVLPKLSLSTSITTSNLSPFKASPSPLPPSSPTSQPPSPSLIQIIVRLILALSRFHLSAPFKISQPIKFFKESISSMWCTMESIQITHIPTIHSKRVRLSL